MFKRHAVRLIQQRGGASLSDETIIYCDPCLT
jgi:hypothetical protein